MDVNLFTFIAQICNFFILVLALYYFLYKRIIRAIDMREEKIRKEFSEAETKNIQAEEYKKEFEEKSRELAENREEMIREAKEETAEKKEEWTKEVKRQIEEKKQKWQQRLEEEREKFLEEIEEVMNKQLISTTKKVIQDLAEEELQSKVIKKLFSMLEKATDEEREEIKEKWRESKNRSLIVVSFLPLPEEDKDEIKKKISSFFEEEMQIEWREDPKLSLGITITFNGYKIEWSAREYLEQISKELSQMVSVE